MRKLIILILVISLMPAHLKAEDAISVEESIEDIKADLDAIRSDLSEVKKALRFIMNTFKTTVDERSPTKDVTYKSNNSSNDDFVLGNLDAPVTMHFFLDYQCGFSSRFYKTILNKLKRDYIDGGKLKIIFRDAPGDEHQMAAPAASFASCAGEQGKYLEAANALFYHPDILVSGDIKALYKKVAGLNAKQMDKCLTSVAYMTEIRGNGFAPSNEAFEDLQEGKKMTLRGTPSFFVTSEWAQNAEVSGVYIRGIQRYDIFVDVIEEQLAKTNSL